MSVLELNTSKDEDLLLVNDADSRIVIFSSPTNLKFLCDDVPEIYADGTFKNSSFLIIFAGLDEISSVAFRFTRFLTSFLSKERSLAGWLWSSVPDKILVESAPVLILALHFCLFKEQRQDISPGRGKYIQWDEVYL
jgi:hypothetical protein